jgi:murein DD-endopeptidase MepM/ murein hydrolase activator NlpD
MKLIDREALSREGKNFGEFLKFQGKFWADLGTVFLGWLGVIKTETSKLMYRQRGRFSQSFINAAMAVIFFLAITLSGTVERMIAEGRSKNSQGSNYLIMATDGGLEAQTLVSDLPKGETTQYRVQDGDTISSIAQKFGVSIDTIVWNNNLKSVDAIKPNQLLNILPVTGVKHKVKRGETIYSIAKYYNVDAQNIIDYPFNTFTNDETFALAAGQELIVPEGVMPKQIIIDTGRYLAKSVAPIPGVVGEGSFIWPTSGIITQKFSWYHPAVDIANHANPPISAAQGGTVITAGWNGGGYGHYVIIDHGNGYQTLYGHMLDNSVLVKAGDKVKQGQKLGTMGSTGRSTGTHLHFEIKLSSGGKIDPLSMLK